MKTLILKAWTEPAAFISALVVVLIGAQTAVPATGTAHAIITAALVALGGHQIRRRVTPIRP